MRCPQFRRANIGPSQATSQASRSFKLATNKRRSFSGHGGLLNRMFGSSDPKKDEASSSESATMSPTSTSAHGNESAVDRTSPERKTTEAANAVTPTDKKRRSSSVTKAKEIFSSAKQAFSANPNNHHVSSTADKSFQTPLQKLSKQDPALGVPQGSQNNSAGESMPGPKPVTRTGGMACKTRLAQATKELLTKSCTLPGSKRTTMQ